MRDAAIARLAESGSSISYRDGPTTDIAPIRCSNTSNGGSTTPRRSVKITKRYSAIPSPKPQKPTLRRSQRPPQEGSVQSIESPNSKFRAECFNARWFMNVSDAQRKCDIWRRDYNEIRPNSAIVKRTPSELAKSSSGAPRMTNNRKIFSLRLVQKSGPLIAGEF